MISVFSTSPLTLMTFQIALNLSVPPQQHGMYAQKENLRCVPQNNGTNIISDCMYHFSGL
jgi:hypothetical protein